jgi:hypothetical protein
MANYGTQTIGGVMQSVEAALQGLLITLPGSESITSTMVWAQSTNASTCDIKSALYDSTTLALVYESNQLSFADDTGGWKTITWPATTPTAGSYYLVVGALFLSGGANDTRIAVATVGTSANYRRQSGGANSYPIFADPFVPDASTHDQDPSLYLVTSSGLATPNRLPLLGVG